MSHARLLIAMLVIGACETLHAADAPAPSKFADLDGLKIHYVERGDGAEALVFVHGWCCDASFWKRQLDGLGIKRHVIAIDLPGHGESDKPKIDYTMDLYARAIDAVRRDAGVQRVVLVSHSNGTPAARQFYRKFSENTSGFVVVDGPLRPMADKATMDKFIEPLRHMNHMEARGDLIGQMVAPIEDLALRKEIKKGMLRTPQHVALSEFEAITDPAIWQEDKINVPTLLVLAKQPVWSAGYERFVRQLVPNLDYQVWENTSHFIMMEKPQEFNEALLAFLAKNHLMSQ